MNGPLKKTPNSVADPFPKDQIVMEIEWLFAQLRELNVLTADLEHHVAEVQQTLDRLKTIA